MLLIALTEIQCGSTGENSDSSGQGVGTSSTTVPAFSPCSSAGAIGPVLDVEIRVTRPNNPKFGSIFTPRDLLLQQPGVPLSLDHLTVEMVTAALEEDMNFDPDEEVLMTTEPVPIAVRAQRHLKRTVEALSLDGGRKTYWHVIPRENDFAPTTPSKRDGSPLETARSGKRRKFNLNKSPTPAGRFKRRTISSPVSDRDSKRHQRSPNKPLEQIPPGTPSILPSAPSRPKSCSPAPGMIHTPFVYQAAGVYWWLEQEAGPFGAGLVGDEMGLGKVVCSTILYCHWFANCH